ncbi:hypothetical protein ONZ51_g6016 [Trametes cubensis]|uniref:Uncharacterized protein n=1 Tax=Trametes cubensis TaxID=1111947 RepID=A0AAD7TU21_9APHY|nr:hypothetical protein ONZ51_g6016 [Trametes cubensis]
MAPKRKRDANTTTAATAKKTRTRSTASKSAKATGPATEVSSTEGTAPADAPAATSEKTPSAVETARVVAAKPAAPRFEGKFDLYSTRLPFLMSEYLPAGASKPDFTAVYNKILFFQAKPDFTLRIVLDASGEGRLACSEIVNPISDEELEPIMISGATKRNVRFNAEEAAHTSTVGSGEGFKGKLVLEEMDGCGIGCSGKGTFKMRRVWESEAKELFEGWLDLRITYGPTLRRKGCGNGDTTMSSFWAVRALKDANGEEIGIDKDI